MRAPLLEGISRRRRRRTLPLWALVVLVVLSTGARLACSAPPPGRGTRTGCVRCGSDCRPVRGKAPSSGYDTSYLFPVTRTLADRCWHPALTVPLTPLTLVADIVELPFGLVLGFF